MVVMGNLKLLWGTMRWAVLCSVLSTEMMVGEHLVLVTQRGMRVSRLSILRLVLFR